MADGLAIRTLGGLEISLDGAPIGPLASRKAEALLVYLACQGRPVAREVLADLLWDDLPPARSRGNLSVLLTSLRQRLPAYLEIGRHSVAFRPSAPAQVDAAALRALAEPALALARPSGALPAEAARRLEGAVALYGGEFLHGFALRDGRGFEEWARGEQEGLRSLAVRSLLALAQTALEAADFAAGIAAARRLLLLEPLHEDAHHLLLLLLASSGQRGPALAHYEELCRLLDQELDAAPAQRTTELYRAIWQGAFTPRPRPASPRRGELRGAPFQATSFVGREAELAAVAARLADPDCRLLTLLGPGGAGKTRLALRAGADRAAALADGGVFVPLAALSAAAQAPAAIAAALRFTFRGSADPLAQLGALLRERELLLILDNAEHLPGLADAIAELLAATPRLQILVTSRERLALQAEWLVALDGLGLPPADGAVAELEASASARLFAQRARAARPDFSLAEAPGAVAQICRMLEGLPLAIELAAAAARELPAPQIAERLGRGLDLLAAELRDLPGRHRSMRAVFEHSWALLDEAERATLSTAAVCRGGFTAAAAAAPRPEDDPASVAAALDALVDKSLLRQAEGGRFSCHELIRQLAAERLPPDQAGALAARHAALYLGAAREGEPDLLRADPQAAAELRAERDNLRAAWLWACSSGEAGALAAGLGGLAQLYDLDGLFAEGLALLDEAAAAPGLPPGLAARIAAGRARFLLRLGRYEEALPALLITLSEAERLADPALEAELRADLAQARWRLGEAAPAREEARSARDLAIAGGLPRVEAAAERTLANLARQQGDAPAAEAHARRALALAHGLGDAREECRALNLLGGLLEERGAFAESRQRFEQALALARALGDRWIEGVILGNLGNVARDVGDHSAAYRSYEESLRIYRSLGDRYGEGILRFSLGNAALDWGDYAEAEREYGESLGLAAELGDRLGESLALMGLGNVVRQRGLPGEALELCRRAHELALALEARPFAAVTAIFLGHTLLEAGRLAEGAATFARAAELRAAIGETHRAVEALAGLARAALLAGDLAGAARHAAPVADRAAHGPLEGVSEPMLIYLICGQALAAAGDRRGQALLAAGAGLLRSRAAVIADPARRTAYLSAVPAHAALLALA